MRAAIFVCLLAQGAPPPAVREAERVEFNRDIRPLLAENCFACHGPDRKHTEARLRLDTRGEAEEVLGAGRPDRSELLRRIASRDREERMPPAKTGKKLDARQIALLRRWIEQGAEYQGHWAFVPPVGPALPPAVPGARNGIDRFIFARLAKEGLKPSPEADRETLLRRATLDLTGLPPSPAEIDAFLADRSGDAYEKAVDRLLASPRYGERMAMDWMDAARYADTHGLHVDSHRDMWPWRDWVIAAFNANMPFDRFTLEQLAGDLLPEATVAQKVASGFNRNHMISYQGSSIPEKVRVGYIVDRVNTTATVWMGLTVGCAQCHDHKFDPVTQKEYYGLYAFFNTVAETALDGRKGNAEPLLVIDPAQDARLRHVRRRIAELQKAGKAAEAKELEKEELEVLRKSPNVMVMGEAARPRETRLLKRGEYNQPGEKVEPGTPACLPPPAADLPRNRLGLAKWLADPRNPLTARVTVNRLWQMLFGTGLVATADDFGTQGEYPSHPELLDWLALEFVDGGSDVKATLRLIATSAAYRQASRAPEALVRLDPQNRLLARGPRFRLPAEMIRDGALAAGGLLVERIGGPGVFPYQPAGVWESVATQEIDKYTAQVYRQDRGDGLHRRSLYTFWKRLAPPPAMAALDAPSREVCVVRRQRTNTPLQALVLMNDPTFVEAARALAELAMKEAATPADRIALGFRRALGRRPSTAEAAVLEGLHRAEKARFEADRAGALRLLSVGDRPRDVALDAADFAAWTMVMHAILNLDEAITRE